MSKFLKKIRKTILNQNIHKNILLNKYLNMNIHKNRNNILKMKKFLRNKINLMFLLKLKIIILLIKSQMNNYLNNQNHNPNNQLSLFNLQ